MNKQQPTSGDRLRQKYRDGLLTLLSLQPEFSGQGIDQNLPANELQQGDKEPAKEGGGKRL